MKNCLVSQKLEKKIVAYCLLLGYFNNLMGTLKILLFHNFKAGFDVGS